MKKIATGLCLASCAFAPGVLSAAQYTFDFTGAEQTWTVPSGMTSIVVDARGAGGGTDAYGGKGGRVLTTLGVTPGETLRIYVGGTDGFNGGGTGGASGGASDIRRGGSALANRVVVAGGGGGGAGGPLGGAGGYNGENGAANGGGASGGGGATQSAGGSGGSGNDRPGTAGSLGQGGNAGGNGGAGGGGYYGGGGGSGSSYPYPGAGGGGGSSYSAGTGTTWSTGYQDGNGQVFIMFTLPTPTPTPTETPTPTCTPTGTPTETPTPTSTPTPTNTPDVVPPDAPVISHFRYDSGGRITDIEGTAEPGSVVRVRDGAAEVGSVAASGGGGWCLTPGTPLAAGPHSIHAVAEDASHNPSEESDHYSLSLSEGVNASREETIAHGGGISTLIRETGSCEFKLAANDGLTPDPDRPVTVNAWLRKNGDYTGTAPKVTLTGLGIGGTGAATDSMTLGAETWEELTVTGTPNAQGVLTLKVETFSTASNAKAWVDDVTVSQ